MAICLKSQIFLIKKYFVHSFGKIVPEKEKEGKHKVEND